MTRTTPIRALARVTLLFVLMLAPAAVCNGQDSVEAVGSVPPSLRSLKFGVAMSEVQKAIPDAKPLGTAADPRSALFVYFKPPEVWDAAMLDFVGGKLEAINFLIGTYKTSDMAQRSAKLLTSLIALHGADYSRTIALNSSKQPVPVSVWTRADYTVIAVGPSLGFTVGGKQIFPPDPQLSVGIARKTRPIEDIVPLASPAELRELLFKALSPVGER